MLITEPNNINKFRLLTLQSALKLEVLGLSRRGRSAYSIIKQEFGLTGSKAKALEQFSRMIDNNN